ncbi:transporter [Mycolicibacter senuensis]|uniref:transporter n=1 Tax=Mycolicibacter senuensis TaxID=386913 RepID=UPI000DCEAE3C|nr:transporter [Mycolicibacter senuensis]RAV00114.1 transporter [Mycolicibacter senuensis]
MKDMLFLLADVWLIVVGFYCGWTFLRNYGNWLLGLECLVVSVSATNFLVGSLLGAESGSVPFSVAFFLDAFSRSFGFTLVLVLGLMAVTHQYKPTLPVEIGAFGLAIAGGFLLGGLDHMTLHVGPATFYLTMNLLTTLFLAYFVTRLWGIGEKRLAGWAALVTAAGTTIAVTYDFFPLPFDDELRTIFYTAALTTWGAQGLVYYLAYRAMHAHNTAADAKATSSAISS